MMPSRPIIREPSLANYFRVQLTDCAQACSPPPQPDTLWYLGDMLARFGNSEEIFSYDDGHISLRPLALLYSDAREASTLYEKKLLLRQLGDLALFLGALFPESFSRRGIRKDYLVGMGGSAYAYLSTQDHQLTHVFDELATTFTKLLRLIAQACARTQCFDAMDIFQLYQRWQHTGDPLAREQLAAVGISVPSSHRVQ